jgi:cobalt-precorrin-7 (C5)-methyltransferase
LEHKVIVAGIGPGHPDYVLPAAIRAIREAEVLVGGSRALSDFAHEGQRTMTIRSDIPAVLEFIREALSESDVVVMVSGDPGYYSLLDALRREFDEECLSVIPGISSVQFAFARLALPWHDASLLSFHGRRPSDAELAYEPGRVIGMLTDTKNSSRTIPKLLMEMGWPEDAKAAICARLSYEDERVVRTTLAGAATEKEETHCVMVVMG